MMYLTSSAKVLVVVMIACTAVIRQVSGACHHPAVPTDLELISSVEQSDVREVHLHGYYRIGDDSYNTEYNAMVRYLGLRYEDSDHEFRVSVAPHSAADMGLELREISKDGDGKRVTKSIASSLSGGREVEKMIYAILKKNVQYELIFIYTVAWEISKEVCPEILLELAVQPVKLVKKFHDLCDGGQPVVPELPKPISPSAAQKYYYKYSSAHTTYWTLFNSHVGPDDEVPAIGEPEKTVHNRFTKVAVYPMSLPYLKGRSQYWKLRVALQSRFLDGGDLGILITPGDVEKLPTPDECAKNPQVCLYGTRVRRNHVIVQDVLAGGHMDGTPGNYKIWIVIRTQSPMQESTCAPYAFAIDVFPMPDRNNLVACDVRPMPATFNVPGLYDDETGVLSYSQAVLINTSVTEQQSWFRTTKKFDKSLIRVFLQNHDSLDLDVVLYKRSAETGKLSPMTSSKDAQGAPDGLIWELSKGEQYALGVKLVSPIRQISGDGGDLDFFDFCDSFELSVHVFPVVDKLDDDSTCGGTTPQLGSMQKMLNNSGSYKNELPSSGLYPYVYKLDLESDAGQKQILARDFFIPKTLAFSLTVPAESYSGTIEIKLERKFDKHIEPKYGHRRSVGSSLNTVLEAGWYTLSLLTPYMQRPGKTFNEVFGSGSYPSCIRYNFQLTIKENIDCIEALAFPVEYPSTRHNHRHVFDVYRVPHGGHVTIQVAPKEDSLLHILLAQIDVAVGDMYVKLASDESIGSKGAIAKGNRPFQGSVEYEMYTVLKAETKYVIVIEFATGESSLASCHTVQAEMSLTKDQSDGEDSSCSMYDELPDVLNLGRVNLPVEMESKPISIRVKSQDGGDRVPLHMLDFSVPMDAHLRLVLRYSFEKYSINAAICETDLIGDTPCIVAGGRKNERHFDGVRISREKNYTIVIATAYPEQAPHNCMYAMLQVFAEPIVPHHVPEMCPGRSQFMPKTLDGVGMLHPLYNEEMHFFEHVRMSTSHIQDRTEFDLRVDATLRVYIPINPMFANYKVQSGVTGKTIIQAASPDGALLVNLKQGKYILVIGYYPSGEAMDPSACTTVPIEISILPTKDLKKLVAMTPAEKCGSDDHFPKEMFHHGHTTLYRKPSLRFQHQINFKIGERGGAADIDIRYHFETAGLAVKLQGLSPSNEITLYENTYFADRTFLNPMLPEGQYRLVVFDPTGTDVYQTVDGLTGVDPCVPYSIHLRLIDRGNYNQTAVPSTFAPPLPPPSDASDSHAIPLPTTPPPKPEEPTLDCGTEYDTFPTIDTASSFRTSGSAYKIPFDNVFGQQEVQTPTGDKRVVYMAKHAIMLIVKSGSYVRIWTRSRANVFLQLRLYKGNASLPLAYGKAFGWATQSMTYHSSTSEYLRFEIEFFFYQAPKYKLDYATCEQKMALSSYEMLVTVFPEAELHDATRCTTQQLGLARKDRLPVETLTLTAASTTKKTYVVTQDDLPQQSTHQHLERRKLEKLEHAGKRMLEHSIAARRRSASVLQSGGGGGSSSSGDDAYDILRLPITAMFSKKIVIPTGTMHGGLIVHMKYNMAITNMRIELFSEDGGSRPVISSEGTPNKDDETFSGSAYLSATNLKPGTYYLNFTEANAEQRHKNTIYCVPFFVRMTVYADIYSDGVTQPPEESSKKPHVADFYPISVSNLDIADSFQVHVKLSEPAKPQFELADDGGRFAYLEGDYGEARSTPIYPQRSVFLSETHISMTFAAYSLMWKTKYTLKLRGDIIKSKKSGSSFDVSYVAEQKPAYTTGTCGCDGGRCTASGSCPCEEPSGDSCDACADDFRLSHKPHKLGHGEDTVSLRICVPSSKQHKPPVPATPAPHPDDHSNAHTATPRPPSSPSGTPDPYSDPYGDNSNDLNPTPANGNTPPSTPPANTNNEARPPLHALRYGLAISALVIISVNVVLWSRKLYSAYGYTSAQRGFQGVNPFRERGGIRRNAEPATGVTNDSIGSGGFGSSTTPPASAGSPAAPPTASITIVNTTPASLVSVAANGGVAPNAPRIGSNDNSPQRTRNLMDLEDGDDEPEDENARMVR